MKFQFLPGFAYCSSEMVSVRMLLLVTLFSGQWLRLREIALDKNLLPRSDGWDARNFSPIQFWVFPSLRGIINLIFFANLFSCLLNISKGLISIYHSTVRFLWAWKQEKHKMKEKSHVQLQPFVSACVWWH